MNAWRYWALRSNSAHGPYLASPFTGTPQLTAEEYAACNVFASPIKALLLLSGRFDALDPVPDEPPPHPYPHWCGVAATRDRAEVMWWLRETLPALRAGEFAVGPVDLLGGVIHGQREVRASGYRLCGPLEVPSSRADWIPALQARYGVPFVVSPELATFVATYGRAAGLVLSDSQGRVLLTRRSGLVDHPGTWAFPGGALAVGETATAAALREAHEEIGIAASQLEATAEVAGADGYTYVLARLRNPVTLALNWESTAAEWVPAEDVAALPLHPGLAATWDTLRAALPTAPTEPAAGREPKPANEVHPGLWIGGSQMPYPPGAEWDAVLTVCSPLETRIPAPAHEYRVPLWDATIPHQDPSVVPELAQIVVARVRSGERLMVRCALGLNRSALVVGLALVELAGITGTEAVARLRTVRGPSVLNNQTFERTVCAALPKERAA